MYCTTVFCLRRIYVSIISNPASDLAASSEVYSYFLTSRRRGSFPISRRATWS